jgi:membrane fusion protein, heavy metal efflux system
MKNMLILLSGVVFLLSSCQKAIEGEHTHGPEGHSHAPEGEDLAALAFTRYTDKTELFVEFKPLIVGQTRNFAAHLTELGHFKPLREGSCTVSLIQAGKGIRNMAQAPTSPGIFRPALQPKTSGLAQLVFDIQTKDYRDRIVIDSVRVYPDEKTALSDQQAEGAADEITYLKEQAWKVDFANAPVQPQPFGEVISASGQILPAQGEEAIVSAKTSGFISFGANPVLAGKGVRLGEKLFTLSGSQLVDGNLDARLAEAKAQYEKASADFERAQELVKDRIVSEKDFLATKTRYETARIAYQTLSRNYTMGGQAITAPISGFIKNVLVSQGQYVTVGQPLVSITRNRRLIIQADVSQRYFSQLSRIQSATFRLPYADKVYSLEELHGKIISYGRNADVQTGFAPIYFEVDNGGQLVPGSFLEVALKTNTLSDALVIPTTALLEQQGTYSVYVQTAGESFQKREVKLGGNDGLRVQILSGVQPGERVVTQGAYQIRLSSLSGTLPAHGHEH